MKLFFTIILGALLLGCTTDTSNTTDKTKIKTKAPSATVKTFEDCFIAGGNLPESYPRQCFLGNQNFVENRSIGSKGEARIFRFKIEPKAVTCQGLYSVYQTCLVVNGESFFEPIVGYTHQKNKGKIIHVERTQICNPKQLNDCPQDVSIYLYKILKSEE